MMAYQSFVNYNMFKRVPSHCPPDGTLDCFFDWRIKRKEV